MQISSSHLPVNKQIIKDFQDIAPGYIVKPHLYNFAEYGVPECIAPLSHRENILAHKRRET